jgi:glycosyltransferase involved in cell wall biosynthesis
MENISYFDFNGSQRIYIKRLFPAIQNSFTYELWVKPETTHHIDSETQKGTSGINGQRYVISPEHGETYGEAGAGISIGTNGISVYEHTAGHLPATLVYPISISNWTHVAVVYNNRTPSLYINGKLVKTGLPSAKSAVLASGVFGGLDPYGFFVGKLGYIRIWNYARTQQQIQNNITQPPTDNEPGLFGYWEFNKESNYNVLSNTDNITIKNASHRKGILFVLNNIGGGTEHYQNLYIEEIKQEFRIYTLKFRINSIYIEEFNNVNSSPIILNLKDCNHQTFQNLLKRLGIDLIYINHLIGFPVFKVIDLIQYSKIKYLYFIPDFFCACPSYNLMNSKGVYCNNETDTKVCQQCLNSVSRRNILINKVNIQEWRSLFLSFLSDAQEVIAPSNSTKEIIQKYYPTIPITVHEPTLPSTISYTFNPQFIKEDPLNIAFIGAIHQNKGYAILYELKDAINKEKLPICIKVIGTTNIHKHFISPDKKFIVTGQYNNGEISHLLAKHKVSIVVISSICPETFSYTTHEALASGYPVIAFNLGAPAEVIKKHGGGWVVEPINSDSILQLLKNLLANRDEILQKAKELVNT